MCALYVCAHTHSLIVLRFLLTNKAKIALAGSEVLHIKSILCWSSIL